jgi:hypothetical protein
LKNAIPANPNRRYICEYTPYYLPPHRHLVVDVTITSARTYTNVPRMGARLPLPGSLAWGAHHGKLAADLRTSALLGTPSVHSVHDYYPFAMEDGG